MTAEEQFIRREFSVFSRNLEAYRPDLKDAYICPLCWCVFDNIDEQWPLLSRAHIIPQFMRPGEQTLTCKRCNHDRLGAEIEGHEDRRLKERRAWAGQDGKGKKVGLSLESSEGERVALSAAVYIDPNDDSPRLRFVFDDDRCSPEHAEKVWRIAQEDCEVSISGKAYYDPWRASLVSLSIAYLRLFHEMGYEWVLTPIAKLIRQQLLNPDSRLIKPHVFASKRELGPQPRFFIVDAPEVCRGVCVYLPEEAHDGEPGFIWIPRFHESYPDKAPVELAMHECQGHEYESCHEGLNDPGNSGFWHSQIYPNERLFMQRPD